MLGWHSKGYANRHVLRRPSLNRTLRGNDYLMYYIIICSIVLLNFTIDVNRLLLLSVVVVVVIIMSSFLECLSM